MAVTNFSPLLGLALPTTGDLAGTWGTTVNDSITSLLDSAVAGTTTLSTDGDVTLSTTNGAANQARNAVLLCTGARTALRTITAPAQSKAYVVINNTTGGFSVKVVGSGPTTGVTVLNGRKALIAWDGSDFVIVASTQVSLTSEVTGTLPVSSGGTGTTSLTANNVLLGNGTSALQVVAPGATGNLLTSDGTTWVSNSPATAGIVTSISVASANGFAGTSSGGATPALTLSTSITGILQGNGTAVSAVTIGSGLSYSGGTLSVPATTATPIGLVRALSINCILP